MKIRHIASLAFGALAACSNQNAAIANATRDAQLSAFRAEKAAEQAEAAAEQANLASSKLQKLLGNVEDSQRRANDVVARLCSCPAWSIGPTNDKWYEDCFEYLRRVCGPN